MLGNKEHCVSCIYATDLVHLNFSALVLNLSSFLLQLLDVASVAHLMTPVLT